MTKYFKDTKYTKWNIILKVENFKFSFWDNDFQCWIPVPEPPSDYLKEITEEEAFLEILCEE